MTVVHLIPNRPSVLDEVFDGEAVLVNLETGRYFALSPTATKVWTALGDGLIWDELLRATGSAVDGTELLAFAIALQRESLIAVEGTLPALPAERPEPSAGAPTFEVFTDMEDLLRLDPIHDIDLDGSGWPAPASA